MSTYALFDYIRINSNIVQMQKFLKIRPALDSTGGAQTPAGLHIPRVARGPKFVTTARNFKLTRPAAKFLAHN